MNLNNLKTSSLNNKSDRILKEETLPGILDHPIPETLHGDRDYDYLDQKETPKTVITSAITQEDIEFYDQLEEKKEKTWKRRLKQDEEFKRELEKIKSKEILLNNLEDLKNKAVKTPKTYFQEDYNKNKTEVKVIIKSKATGTTSNLNFGSNSTSNQNNKANTESKSNNLLLEGYSSEDD